MDNKNTERKKVAVLIDAENISLKYLEKIFERAKSEGAVCFKRIYGNVTVRKNAVNPLLEYGITHIQSYSYVPDKNTADMVLAVDAMVQLYKNDVDVFCIVSSDSDFAPLVNKIIEEGRTVIGMGESKAVKSFQNSCDEFVILNESVTEENKSEKPKTEKAVKAKEADEKEVKAEVTKQDEAEQSETEAEENATVAEPQTESEENTEPEATSAEPTPEAAEDSENKPAAVPETAEELRAIIVEILNGLKSDDGRYMQSQVFDKLTAMFGKINPKKYFKDAKSNTDLIEKSGFIVERRYKNNKKSGVYDVYIRIPESFGEQTPPTAETETKLDKAATVISDKPQTGLPTKEELTESIIDIIKTKGTADGKILIPHLLTALKKRFSDSFDIKEYKLGKKPSEALAKLGFDIEANYVGLGIHMPAAEDAAESAPTDTEAEPLQTDNTDSESETTAPVYETEANDTTDITVAVEADTDTEDGYEEAAEEPEEEEPYVLPVVNELPEQIGTLEELKTAILFILNHESVSSPTRLTAAIKYWYPDFKLKDYGYTKMAKLLEDLEIYVF